MNILAFAENCTSKRNNDQVVIVQRAESALQRTQNFYSKSFKIFGKNMAAMNIAKTDLLE